MFSEGEEMYLQGKRLDIPDMHCAGVKLVIVLLGAGTVMHTRTHAHILRSLLSCVTIEGVSKPE